MLATYEAILQNDKLKWKSGVSPQLKPDTSVHVHVTVLENGQAAPATPQKTVFPPSVVETDEGPKLAGSRLMVYDVMQTLDEGYDIYFICVCYDITLEQARVCLEYIDEHRPRLEAELVPILKKKAEREAYHRAIQEERMKIIRESPPSEKRKEFLARVRQNRIRRGEIPGDVSDNSE